jgi:hypothetical protein
MTDKPIQLAFGDELVVVISKLLQEESVREALGDKLMEAVQSFARRDMDSVADLENKHFRFVKDASLREQIAKTFYGARWLYKLGLALLARDEELGAHVRAQVTDYGAVAEALLSYAIGFSIKHGRIKGDRYKWSNYVSRSKPIAWDARRPESALEAQSFAWLIEIAFDFGIIDKALKVDLHWLRDQRNTVHLRKLASIGRQAFLGRSMRAFNTVVETSAKCRTWCLGAA